MANNHCRRDECVDMRNVAETQAYLADWAKREAALFGSDRSRERSIHYISDELICAIHDYEYDPVQDGYPWHMHGAEVSIATKVGEKIYSYRNLDIDGGFLPTLFSVGDQKYIVFRRDLYGYSVLKLSDCKAFHYFPAESFPVGETFIWCSAHFNPHNDLLAVDGCMWAAPSSVLLADFRNPMSAAHQIDVHDFLDKDFERYGDIEFAKWDGESLLLNVSCIEDDNVERITITRQEYDRWFALDGNIYDAS